MKPFAYAVVSKECPDDIENMSLQFNEPVDVKKVIPLYTHPAKETNYKFGVDWGKDNKSVTVVKIHDDGVAEIVFVDYQERTHPANLTDEEIIEIGNAVTNLIDSNEGWIEFARAILRKAQEK